MAAAAAGVRLRPIEIAFECCGGASRGACSNCKHAHMQGLGKERLTPRRLQQLQGAAFDWCGGCVEGCMQHPHARMHAGHVHLASQGLQQLQGPVAGRGGRMGHACMCPMLVWMPHASRMARVGRMRLVRCTRRPCAAQTRANADTRPRAPLHTITHTACAPRSMTTTTPRQRACRCSLMRRRSRRTAAA